MNKSRFLWTLLFQFVICLRFIVLQIGDFAPLVFGPWAKLHSPTFTLVSAESLGLPLSKYGQNMGQRAYAN